jgi:soluble lytic murein transglycosylase-like protein
VTVRVFPGTRHRQASMLNDIRYFWRLARSVFGRREHRRMPVYMGSAFLALALPLSGFYAVAATGALNAAEPVSLEGMQARANAVGAVFDRIADSYESEVGPIQSVLLRYRNDTELTRRIAVALVGQGRRSGVDPRVLLAVMLVENPMLQPQAESPMGARGLMQIMPGHRGHWGCGPDMESIEGNICYGARIFASYLREEGGDVERALLSYNGCHRSANCATYASYVYQRAGRASILASLPRPRHTAE